MSCVTKTWAQWFVKMLFILNEWLHSLTLPTVPGSTIVREVKIAGRRAEGCHLRTFCLFKQGLVQLYKHLQVPQDIICKPRARLNVRIIHFSRPRSFYVGTTLVWDVKWTVVTNQPCLGVGPPNRTLTHRSNLKVTQSVSVCRNADMKHSVCWNAPCWH